MNKNNKQIINAGLMLALFAMVGTSVVTITNKLSKDKIIQNEKNARLAKLYQVFDKNTVNNNFLNDAIDLKNDLLDSKKPAQIYRLRYNDIPVGVIVESATYKGYSGKISLIIGIRFDGSISGVRVVRHQETPGLGDKIDARKSDWIKKFNNKSLKTNNTKQWQVQKDGGIFTQFSGATITPRAIVKAVKNSLIFYEQNKLTLY
ncbi:MAG: electron transport complex subunit RsxG [Gammaproteobacteria bacterium]|nr:MAG: electron transport complex subunit RsxG [Gammaproteobacteria bacterium]